MSRRALVELPPPSIGSDLDLEIILEKFLLDGGAYKYYSIACV